LLNNNRISQEYNKINLKSIKRIKT